MAYYGGRCGLEDVLFALLFVAFWVASHASTLKHQHIFWIISLSGLEMFWAVPWEERITDMGSLPIMESNESTSGQWHLPRGNKFMFTKHLCKCLIYHRYLNRYYFRRNIGWNSDTVHSPLSHVHLRVVLSRLQQCKNLAASIESALTRIPFHISFYHSTYAAATARTIITMMIIKMIMHHTDPLLYQGLVLNCVILFCRLVLFGNVAWGGGMSNNARPPFPASTCPDPFAK